MTPSTSESTRAEEKRAVLEQLNKTPFKPAWWLRNSHAQSFWNPLIRRQVPIDYEKEVWETPDGDRLTLCHHRGDPVKPWVLLLHGLEGTADSFYVTALNRAFHSMGWNVATMLFRSCDGEINRSKQIYHMGATWDVDWVVSQLPERCDVSRLHVVGVSLGANVLCKWLGELGDDVPPIVHSAAALSPPFRPEVAIHALETALFGLYNRKFLRTLIPKALAKERQFPGCIDVEKVRNCTSFHVYDSEVTARLHGFDDAMDYWKKVGCAQFLEGIRVPTLLLTSADDPFNPGDTIPRDIADASDYLYPQWTERGGHVGFVEGALPWRARYWMEEQVLRFFVALDERR